MLIPDPFGELCYSDFFADSTSLDQAFPNGEYAFSIFGSVGLDSKTLDLQATEPGGYLDILSPSEGASVPSDQDLIFTWTLAEKINGIGCIAGMSCADEISVEIDEFSMTGLGTIFDERLPTTASGTVLPASELQVDAFYEAGIATSIGTSNPNDTTDMGDPTETVATFEDVNLVSFLAVPEPAAGLLGLTAMLSVAGVARARARRS